MSSNVVSTVQLKIDGRRRRAEFTRQKILDAAIALPMEGILRPSLQQISERAGISLRTMFEHFPERDLLTRALLNKLTHFDQIDPPPDKIVKLGKLEERIELFLDMRIRRLEELTPLRQISNALIATSPILQKHRLKVRKLYRDIAQLWFAPELDQLNEPVREQRLLAIAALVDWEMWWSLRTYPNRSVGEARADLQFLLAAALHAVNRPSRRTKSPSFR